MRLLCGLIHLQIDSLLRSLSTTTGFVVIIISILSKTCHRLWVTDFWPFGLFRLLIFIRVTRLATGLLLITLSIEYLYGWGIVNWFLSHYARVWYIINCDKSSPRINICVMTASYYLNTMINSMLILLSIVPSISHSWYLHHINLS